ncbi:hypothetical protein RHSIM_Rhsim11G0002800 [Rhododendron simsii]|uniref:Uncharacterized protein n=1 Tax=Rhododendron simsii TaxID=118357 RepID=A0A834LBJ0_RHOSS|nr:hypothetical protein RHSIM_Rhsim11G0002800 [Rhododendron simsii]
MLKAIYFPRGEFMNARKGKDRLGPGLVLSKVGSFGERLALADSQWTYVDFWNDKWVPHSPNFRIQSPKPPWADNLKGLYLGCNWVSFPPIPLLNILCKDASVYQ